MSETIHKEPIVPVALRSGDYAENSARNDGHISSIERNCGYLG